MVTGDDNDDGVRGGDARTPTNSTMHDAIEGEKMSRRSAFSPRSCWRGRGGQWGDGGDEFVDEDLTAPAKKTNYCR